VGPINELALGSIETVGNRRRARAAGELAVWLPEPNGPSQATPVSLILRPEVLRVSAGEIGTDNRYSGQVEDVIYLGASSECRLKVGSVRLSAVMPSAAAVQLQPGAAVSVGWDAKDGVVVDAG